MRRAALIVGAVILMFPANGRPSIAQEFRTYPWCLFSGGSEAGIEVCAFDSFEQCMLTRSGGGGICFTNPAYSGAPESPAIGAEPPRQLPPQRPANQRRRG
jgi:Protein of unknown function (DUF3551)